MKGIMIEEQLFMMQLRAVLLKQLSISYRKAYLSIHSIDGEQLL